jgi:hypothetical protein
MVAVLAAGAAGFLLFTLLKVPPFAGFLAVPAIGAIEPLWMVWAIVLGTLGAALEAHVAVVLRLEAGPRGGGVMSGRIGDQLPDASKKPIKSLRCYIHQ